MQGYATAQTPPQRLSSRAEVIFSNVSKKQVADALTNEMTARGFQVKDATPYSIVYSKADMNERDWAIFGMNPESRISYDLLDCPKGIKVIANQKMVSKAGTAFESVSDFSYYADVVKLQTAFLSNVKKAIEK